MRAEARAQNSTGAPPAGEAHQPLPHQEPAWPSNSGIAYAVRRPETTRRTMGFGAAVSRVCKARGATPGRSRATRRRLRTLGS
ncbi:MAG: hypothetical protein JWP29_3125 [Rhodoferax sp.]|nr:hypothetical protein [Rhodoferax sp.]